MIISNGYIILHTNMHSEDYLSVREGLSLGRCNGGLADEK